MKRKLELTMTQDSAELGWTLVCAEYRDEACVGGTEFTLHATLHAALKAARRLLKTRMRYTSDYADVEGE